VWMAARARSSRQLFARFGILNLATTATRACKTTATGKRASNWIAKVLALDLRAAGTITGRRAAIPDHGQFVARFLPDRRLCS
jgi:hypothetical protein